LPQEGGVGSRHYPGPGLEPSRSEARRRYLCLVGSLGIWLSCQATPVHLRGYLVAAVFLSVRR
jgi:hypothetical protein